MFKKLVSNLPFSPSLVAQLGFYAQRLKKEQAMRKLGVVFIVFALIIQSFSIFSPPESANAASDHDLIRGGVSSLADLKSKCEANTDKIASILKYAGIECSDLTTANGVKAAQICTNDGWRNFGRIRVGAAGETAHEIVPASGSKFTIYSRPLSATMSGCVAGYVGKTKAGLEFGIRKACGNLQLKNTNPHVSVEGDCYKVTRVSAVNPNKFGQDVSIELITNGKVVATVTLTKNGSYTKSNPYTFKESEIPAKNTVVTARFKSNHNVKDTYKVTVDCTPPSITCKKLDISPTSVQVGKEVSIEVKTENITKNNAPGEAVPGFAYIIAEPDGAKQTLSGTGGNRLKKFKPTKVGRHEVKTQFTLADKYKNAKLDVGKCVGSFTATPADTTTAKSASCNSLTVSHVSGTTYALATNATVSGGATISGYTYTVKNKRTGQVVRTVPGGASVNITLDANNSLTESAEYEVSVTVRTSAGDKSGAACTKTITIPPRNTPMCELPGKGHLPKDDPGCRSMCEIPGKEDLPADDPGCKDCTTNPDDEDCQPDILVTKIGLNNTQGNVSTETTVARAGDVITFTINISNAGKVAGKVNLTDQLSDVLEYATLTDQGGGEFNSETDILSWGEIELAAGEQTSRSFAVTVKSPIPSMARGQSWGASFDCVMSNAASGSNMVDVHVDCPPSKIVETVITQLPATGPGENMIFGGVVLAVIVFFYARSRQLGKEVRLVRREFNAGTL
ncbi:hypothetical protein FWD20_02045 [Candidatus Saccharibacteria bacterium]|nr:hypothetical protein [Candidatus Saccharibacteria bacterium]